MRIVSLLPSATEILFALGFDQEIVGVSHECDFPPQAGNKRVVIQSRIPKDAAPPVSGFWSITMYEIDQGWWFVPNALNKFTVSLRNNPKLNADGSLTLYFQNESPGVDKEANWLPAPKGDFIAMMRMYWPKASDPSILNGSWKPPAVQKAS